MNTTQMSKDFFTEQEWDLIYNFVGNALDSDGWNPEDVYEIRSKILNLFETK